MNANVLEAFNIMWQCMAGIFVVIGLLALVVYAMAKVGNKYIQKIRTAPWLRKRSGALLFFVRQLIIPPAMALKEHMAKTVPSRTASAVMVRSWRKDMIRRKAK